MGGVDHNDQLRQYYHVRLKCRKYYKYIFWFLFDVTVSNAFIISKTNPEMAAITRSVKAFRTHLAKEMLSGPGIVPGRERGVNHLFPGDHLAQPIFQSKEMENSIPVTTAN